MDIPTQVKDPLYPADSLVRIKGGDRVYSVVKNEKAPASGYIAYLRGKREAKGMEDQDAGWWHEESLEPAGKPRKGDRIKVVKLKNTSPDAYEKSFLGKTVRVITAKTALIGTVVSPPKGPWVNGVWFFDDEIQIVAYDEPHTKCIECFDTGLVPETPGVGADGPVPCGCVPMKAPEFEVLKETGRTSCRTDRVGWLAALKSGDRVKLRVPSPFSLPWVKDDQTIDPFYRENVSKLDGKTVTLKDRFQDHLRSGADSWTLKSPDTSGKDWQVPEAWLQQPDSVDLAAPCPPWERHECLACLDGPCRICEARAKTKRDQENLAAILETEKETNRHLSKALKEAREARDADLASFQRTRDDLAAVILAINDEIKSAPLLLPFNENPVVSRNETYQVVRALKEKAIEAQAVASWCGAVAAGVVNANPPPPCVLLSDDYNHVTRLRSAVDEACRKLTVADNERDLLRKEVESLRAFAQIDQAKMLDLSYRAKTLTDERDSLVRAAREREERSLATKARRAWGAIKLGATVPVEIWREVGKRSGTAVKEDWSRTRVGRALIWGSAVPSLVFYALFMLDLIVLPTEARQYEEAALKMVVPPPANPNKQFEKDWIEKRAQRAREAASEKESF